MAMLVSVVAGCGGGDGQSAEKKFLNIATGGTAGTYYPIGGAGAILTAPTLLGFGSAGIVAGSVAAATQAAIGNVAAGSLFATMTSLGMTGVLSTLSFTGVGSIAAGIAAAIL